MADPKENEEVSEELSTDELKSVSGGVSSKFAINDDTATQSYVIKPGSSKKPFDPKGSGSGLTKDDWNKRTRDSGFLNEAT